AQRSPYGRISSLRGDLLVKGPEDEDWSYVERNAVVADGDLLQADEDSLAEIEMERGAWLRVGPETRLEVDHLPPGGDLRLLRGAVYVDLSESLGDGVRVRTPSGSVIVEDGALARVDVEKDNEVRVLVRRGRVTADPVNGERQHAGAGQMFYLESAGA